MAALDEKRPSERGNRSATRDDAKVRQVISGVIAVARLDDQRVHPVKAEGVRHAEMPFVQPALGGERASFPGDVEHIWIVRARLRKEDLDATRVTMKADLQPAIDMNREARPGVRVPVWPTPCRIPTEAPWFTSYRRGGAIRKGFEPYARDQFVRTE
jgi:hypothetical protein